MMGLMQDYPLLVPKALSYAERFHPNVEIVSRRNEGDIHRYTFRDLAVRARKLANALTKLGIGPGDIVATIAWNGYRHFELYFALPGMEAAYHTINPRLSPQQLAYVIGHADDKFIAVEPMFLPLLDNFAESLDSLKGVIVLCDEQDMPETTLPNVYCYESLLEAENDDFEWREFDENTAASICYTSGTTGNPKGVVYSHRALILTSMNAIIHLQLACRDVILPIVPMFHINGWNVPFLAAILGTKVVLPGPALDAASIYELMDTEKVTLTAGVPTVAQALLDYLEETGQSLPHLRTLAVGGSAPSRSMLETLHDKYDVEPLHAWGMTETCAVGTASTLTAAVAESGREAILDAREAQGRGIFGCDLRIVDDAGSELPHDGETEGFLQVRGWAVSSAYLKGESTSEFTDDGWFDTGDIARIDANGYMHITDRAKDVIKSGGEWISSIELENAAAGCDGVAMAAVIGVPHPKWDERPLLLIVLKPGAQLERETIRDHLSGKVAKWWIPENIEFVDDLPIGATGKVSKKDLRAHFEGYQAA
jgi:fatty-acyl-CoA synthase